MRLYKLREWSSRKAAEKVDSPVGLAAPGCPLSRARRKKYRRGNADLCSIRVRTYGPIIVAEAIAVLTRAGLADYRGEGRFGYRAVGAETEALVEALSGACASLPFAVKRVIWETRRDRLPPRPDGCC